MASDPKAIIDSWETSFQTKRRLINGLDAAKLDHPTETPGWTVRSLATHLALGSDVFLGVAAPRLAVGKSLLPIPVPVSVFTRIGNYRNRRDVKKYGQATPAELVAAMDESHARGAKGLAGVAADGWDRYGNVPRIGRVTLSEFVREMVAHDDEHAAVLMKALG